MKSNIIFVLLVVFIQAGCISRTRTVPADQRLLPAKTGSREEMLRSLEEKSKQVQTLQGRLDLNVSGGGPASDKITDYRETRGLVVVERPKQIRFKVQVPVVGTTVADMVSDGREYNVSIPYENKFYVGDENVPTKWKNPVFNLKPQHIVKALFMDIAPYLSDPNVRYMFEEATVERRRFYVFNFINISGQQAQLIEKLWIDRTQDLQVARRQLFGPEGRMEMDVEYAEYKSENNIDFPTRIVIQRPIEDFTLKMTFTSTTLNDKVAAEAFALQRPAGAQVIQPAAEETSGLKP